MDVLNKHVHTCIFDMELIFWSEYLNIQRAVWSEVFHSPGSHYGVLVLKYQTTHDTRKEGNVLFNDALNTFYLRLYGVRHILIAREEICCRHIGYSYRLAARVLLYAPSHRQDSTYHGLCYTSLAGWNEK